MFHWGYFFAYDCASTRLGDHWGELQAAIISGGLVCAALLVRDEFPVHWLESRPGARASPAARRLSRSAPRARRFAVTVAVPVTLLGSCIAKQATKCYRHSYTSH